MTRLLTERAPLVTAADRPGTIRVGRTPKVGRDDPDPYVYGPPPVGVLRVVGIDVGLARVSLAYFDCWAKDADRYRDDLLQRASAFRHCWHMTTPPDMPFAERLASIGAELTKEFRNTRPALYFVEEPQAAGTYARNADNASAFGGKFNADVSKVYAALGIIAAVCHEQAKRSAGRVEIRKPLKIAGIVKKESRLEYLRMLLKRRRVPVELGNDNDVDAVGVAVGAPWTA